MPHANSAECLPRLHTCGRCDAEVIEELMAAADTDSNGVIDPDEFKSLMRRGHPKFGALTKAMLTLRSMSDPDLMKAMLRSACVRRSRSGELWVAESLLPSSPGRDSLWQERRA